MKYLQNLHGTVHVGSKVLVPFGTMKRAQEGFVIGFKEKSEFKVKDILSVSERWIRRTKGNSCKTYGT